MRYASPKPTKRDSSRKTHGSSRKWSGRFRRSSDSSNSSQEAGVYTDGGNDSTGGSATFESHGHGPLQSQLDLNHRVDSAQNNSSSHWQPPSRLDTSIDDDIGEYAPRLNPSTSSEKAVFAIEYSCYSPSNKANSPISPSSNSRQIQSPSLSTSYPRQSRPRSGSNALETPKDKDDAYGAWWFLASISESFDTLNTQKNGSRSPQALQVGIKTHVANEFPRESDKTTGTKAPLQDDAIEVYTKSAHHTGTEASAELSKNDDPMYELPSWKHSELSSQNSSQQIEQPHQQHFPPKEQPGREYSAKEQKLRKQWIASDTLGGTLNYDQNVANGYSNESSTAPYHYIPPQHASMLPNAGSNPDWDTEMVGKKRSEDNIEWTPEDSSYGAAVQAFGWIPKRIRKLLEVVVVVLLLALLISVVVKTGMKLKSSGSGGGEEIVFFDDDHYAAFNDDGGNDDNDSEDSESNDGSNDQSNDDHDRLRYR